MDPDELKRRIEALDNEDSEGGHSELDSIWYDVLKHIADCEGGHYGHVAQLAVDALDRVPTRWYA